MGACASKFKVLKSAGDADPPEDVASRDLKPAEDLVKDTETPATVDDEPKRQMLGNLLKADDAEAVARENNGKVSLKVKKEDEQKVKPQENENVKSAESLVADAPAKDAVFVPESRGLEEAKKSQDGKPASENVETAVSQKAAEEKPVEASGKVEIQGIEKPGETENPIEKPVSSQETEMQCLEKAMEEGAEEKHGTETTKEVGLPEVKKKEEQKPVSVESETEKKLEEVMEVSMPESMKNNEKKSASIKGEMEKQQLPPEAKKIETPDAGKSDEQKLASLETAEKKTENIQGGITPTLEIPGTEKLDSEVEMEIKKKSDEAERSKLPEKKPYRRELEDTKVEVEKPADAASNAEKKSEDQTEAAGNTKIETYAKSKAEDNQLVAGGTTKIEPYAEKKAQVVEDIQAEPSKKEQPGGMNKPEEKSGTTPEMKNGS